MPRPIAAGICAVLALAGCVHRPVPPRPLPGLGAPLRVAVLPFRVDPRADAEPVVPETGPAAARVLAAYLARQGFSVVDADRVADAAAVADAARYDARFASRVGDQVGATVAVVGMVTRYRERDGTAWAVRSPASIAYEVALVKVSDAGATPPVLATDRFEHAQRALTDDVARGDGRWLTRAEMLEQALARTAERLARSAAAFRPGAP